LAGTRQTRSDRKTKRLEALRADPAEQARLIGEAQEIVESLARTVSDVYSQTIAIADIRDILEVEPTRPFLLRRVTFSDRSPLFADYETCLDRYREDLQLVKNRSAQCIESLRAIVAADWAISPTEASTLIRLIARVCLELKDSGLSSNDVSKKVNKMLDAVTSLHNNMSSGGTEAGINKAT
jgi:hypothetical protein